MPPTQQNRRAGFKSDNGDDALVLTRCKIHEEMGRMFQIEVELAGESDSVDFNSWVGSGATVWVLLPDGNRRDFHGIISRFAQAGSEGKMARYRATLVPWLWLLTRTADCRIFQNEKAPDIIRAVFSGHGFNDYTTNNLTGTYRTREYCVQYRESDFNFVSRLMEQEGIYYFFKHEEGKHTLVLADSASAHSAYDNYGSIEYRPRKITAEESGEAITDWVAEMEVQTGAYVTGEFNFTTPNAPIVTNDTISRQHPHSSFEVFDYPGEFAVREEGETCAKMRIQELQASHEIARGVATSRGIATGCKFTLEKHPRSDQNRDYVVTAATCHIDNGEFLTGKSRGEEFFTCNFTAVPASEQFRTARTARKPHIRGPQTAFVVGNDGDEITTEEYGRVKVQFHWDRQGKFDQNSSCWIRVSQPWAGGGWGAVVLPRIKQEVVVEFLEGDPDRPLITGCVYNAGAMAPYALPDNKTVSTFMSNSSTGGNGYNEFRFEDKADSEKIYLHGQKDHDVRIKNDTKEWVGNDRHLIVKNDQLEKVENDQHLTIKNDRLEKVENDHHLTVEGERRLKVEGKFGEKLEDDHNVSVGGNDNLSVKGNQVIKVTGDVNLKGQNLNTQGTAKISVQSGDDFNVKSATNYNLESTTALHIKAGTTLVIEAGTQLSLKVGSNFIDIGPSGVSITGSMVNINSGGSAASGAGCSPTAPTAPDSPEDPKDPKDPKEAAES